jgi:hypothetical protein
MKSGSRERAVGTRGRVMTHLAASGEIRDATGMASTALAEAIGYPGSSVAFAQLLSGMERSGLIEREVRGKRTYRIAAARAAGLAGAAGAAGVAGATGAAGVAVATGAAGVAVATGAARAAEAAGQGSAMAAPRGSQRRGRQPTGTDDDADGRGLAVAAARAADLDYDELARRLLVQVVQRLAVSPGDGTQGGDLAEPAGTGPAGTGPAGTGPSGAALQRTVASLEQKLASVQSKQRRLTAENAKLREQLQAAQQSLAEAEARDSAGSIAGRFDTAEVLLLERLLSPLRDQRDRREEAGAG